MFPTSELLAMSESIRCFTEPRVELDTNLLQQILDENNKKVQDALDSVGAERTDLSSDPKFAAMLEKLGIEPPTKLNAKGAVKPAFAKSDANFTDLLQHPDESVRLLVQARLDVKSTITGSRSARLLGISQRGYWPVQLNYASAHTLRFGGGGKVNPQNLGKRDGIRACVRAPKGAQLVVIDLSQIEARLVAYVAAEMLLVEAFRQGIDVYCQFGNASGVFSREVTKATIAERFISKGVVLGAGYGCGAEKLRHQVMALAFDLGIDLDADAIEWDKLKNAYRRQYKNVPKLWYATDDALRDAINQTNSTKPWHDIQFGTEGLMHFVHTEQGPAFQLPNGLKIFYRDLRWEESEGRNEKFYGKLMKGPKGNLARNKIYGAACVENCIQALAGQLIREYWVEIVRRCRAELGIKFGSVINQVHDELILLVKQEQALDVQALAMEVMHTPPVWAPGLPVAAESETGLTYADCK